MKPKSLFSLTGIDRKFSLNTCIYLLEFVAWVIKIPKWALIVLLQEISKHSNQIFTHNNTKLIYISNEIKKNQAAIRTRTCLKVETNIKMLVKTIRCFQKHLTTTSLDKLLNKHLREKKIEWIGEIKWIKLPAWV